MRALVLAATVLAAGPLAAGDYARTREAAMQALQDGDCAALWDGLWRAAKRGEILARSDLAVLGLTEGLAAPGPAQDAATMMRDRLTMSIHGLGAGDPAGRDTTLALARVHAGYSQGAKALVTCLESGTAEAVCADAAVAAGLVAPFPVFAEELDARAALTDSGEARCGAWSDR